MFKRFIKVAFYFLWKDRVISGISLLGLIVGITSFLLIISYVRYELSYDKSYDNSSRVFRVIERVKNNGTDEYHANLPEVLASVLKKEYPQVEASATVRKSVLDIMSGDEPISCNILSVDTTFFNVFDLRFVSGSREALSGENKTIVLTEKFAKKIFPNQEAVGKTIKSHSKGLLRVSGVIADIPANTHFTGEAIVVESNRDKALDWESYYSATQYILLRKEADIGHLSASLSSFYKKFNFPDLTEIAFQPVRSIHLHSRLVDEPFKTSDIKYVIIYAGISFLILFIVSINYINLTTVRLLQRATEVGIRKTLGAGTWEFMIKFAGESLLLFLIAIPFAFMAANFAWPAFAHILEIPTEADYLFQWRNVLLTITVSLVAGIISGLFPSFYLVRVKTSVLLKNAKNIFSLSFGMRRVFMILQFTISISLIISALLIRQQLSLIKTADLGFDKNNILILPKQDLKNKGRSFRAELLKNNHIRNVTIANVNIGSKYEISSSMTNPLDTTKQWDLSFIDADYAFIPTMELKLIQGSVFLSNPEFQGSVPAADSQGVRKRGERQDSVMTPQIVLTEKTVNLMHITHPVGKIVDYGAVQGRIVGIIKDFQGLSFHEENPNMVLRPSLETKTGYTYIRIDPTDLPSTIEFIRKKWKAFFPEKQFDFSFLDDRLARLYASERNLGLIINIFSVIAIGIGCLGLFSLMKITIVQRLKEISIRKVLGATVTEILVLLSKDFLGLIAISLIIAVPATWMLINPWLQSFVNRISFNWVTICVAGGIILGVSFITICFQMMRVARRSPLKGIRTE